EDGQPVTVESKGSMFYVRRHPGDVNGDNQVDTGDLIRLVEFILKTGAPPTENELEEADCNDDGMHNALDIVCLLDVVLSKPGRMHAATTASNASWTIRAEEPVRGLEFMTEGGDWSLTSTSLAPFQLHQPRDLSLGRRAIFDGQGASWEAGSVRTFEAPSSLSGVKAFGAGGRSLSVRIEGNEIRIGAPLPSGLRVLPAAPNPFAGATSLTFSIDKPGRVAVRVYDVRGALVASPEPRMLPAGRHVWPWSAKDNLGRPLPSGLYVAVVDSGTRRSAVRLNHLR
ncbi:MAG TPA: dockerin type I domain-containing protein, partial [Candidatus Eisenbacteria bacterium]|nr:dockerin type I domain-containing protein [Candidatus Eisenbacteria bacterium]